jgi:hypothetical protein
VTPINLQRGLIHGRDTEKSIMMGTPARARKLIFRVALVCLVGVVTFVGNAAPWDALVDPARDATLNRATAAIARVVAKVAKSEGATQIVVNPITDTGDLTHTSGAGVTDKLIEQLRGQGLEAALKADLIFTGSYAVGEAETDGRRAGFAAAKIAFQVRRRNGRVLLDSEKDIDLEHQPRITNPADVQVMGGGTGFLPPSAAAGENDRRILDGLDNKPGLFEIDGATLRPTGAPYAIQMLVARLGADEVPHARAFHSRRVQVRDGAPFLKVEPGEIIAVRIIDNAAHDVAATVTIDGLSMFAFRDDRGDKNEHVVIAARAAGEVLGWYRNNKRSSAFLVADLPSDHPRAAFLKNPARIGSITVTFAAAWEKDRQKPADEPLTRQATEIVPGAPIDAPYDTVDRHIGVHRAAVTVRYDKL